MHWTLCAFNKPDPLPHVWSENIRLSNPHVGIIVGGSTNLMKSCNLVLNLHLRSKRIFSEIHLKTTHNVLIPAVAYDLSETWPTSICLAAFDTENKCTWHMLYHRPAESSTASMLMVESSIQSERARGMRSLSWPCLTSSTFCHSSQRSASPSPSSMRTTSTILGLSVGDICVHSNATCNMSHFASPSDQHPCNYWK